MTPTHMPARTQNRLPALILLATIAAGAALADADKKNGGTVIYRSTDEQGQTVFSDQPSRGAEQVEVKEPNRAPAVKPTARPEKKKADTYSSGYEVAITHPADGDFIANGLRGTNVSATVNPPLLPKHQLEFLHNGESLGAGSSYQTRIERLTPGGHQISARVLDRDGKVLGQSEITSITAQWPGSR